MTCRVFVDMPDIADIFDTADTADTAVRMVVRSSGRMVVVVVQSYGMVVQPKFFSWVRVE